jgi:uncharacterized protein (DUF1330 family)
MAGDATRHVQLWALQISDAASYQRYREAMTPILHSYGGAFGYDFAIARVLASEANHPIDRVFTIAFPDAATADRFFADPAYLVARRSLFEPAVPALTKIASFDEPARSH